MRKFILFTGFLALAALLTAQNLAPNPGFEDWTDGSPDGWVGSKTNFTSGNINQYDTSVHEGSYACQLINTSTQHKRFTTQPVTVSNGTMYTIKFWVRGHGDIRTALFGGGNIWIYSNDYISVNSTDWTQYTQTITSTANSTEAEFIFSIISTNADLDHLQIDTVEILPPSGDPVIIKAWSVSETAVDVLYNLDVEAVDPADYQLTGSASINFSAAAIDGENAKLVHLSGASANMTGDIVVDTISVGTRSDYSFYAGIMPLDYTSTTNPGGTMQNSMVATFNAVVYAVGSNRVWIHDAASAHHGVMIYDYSLDDLVSANDEILFYATRTEYYTLTELVDPVLITDPVTSTHYSYIDISGAAIAENSPADTDPAESYEGQFVRISDLVVDSSVRGDFRASDDGGSTYFLIDDLIYSGLDLQIGNTYRIMGAVDYSYNQYRLLPRSADDVEMITDDTPPTVINLVILDVNTIYVYFSEDVEQLTAENSSNYTINTREVVVSSAQRDASDHTLVILTVSGMIPGDYTLAVENVEDLSGNPIILDEYDFTYSEPHEWTVIINELDSDTPGTDAAEFIELYDGGVGSTDLTGLVVVLFNGSDNASYTPVFDLDGYSTDAQGYFVIGSPLVPEVDLIASPETNFLQNGPDAVALFEADAADFPNDTPVTNINLIDAIVYGTDDPDDPELLANLTPGQPQPDEDGNGDKDNHSLQRIPNGSGGALVTTTYAAYLPTPGAENQPLLQLDPPQNPLITRNGDTIYLSWDAVINATIYKVYSDPDPYGSFLTLETTITGDPPLTSWSESLPAEEIKFYQIVAE